MVNRADMAERHASVLAELTEAGRVIALDLQARALAAETPAEAADVANAFHKVSRSVRQSMALEARFARDLTRADREDREAAEKERKRGVERRRAQVEAAERLIWTEYERDEDEGEDLVAALGEQLDAAVLDDDFAATPIEAQIVRLCEDLGLPKPSFGDDAPGSAAQPAAPALNAPPSPGHPFQSSA